MAAGSEEQGGRDGNEWGRGVEGKVRVRVGALLAVPGLLLLSLAVSEPSHLLLLIYSTLLLFFSPLPSTLPSSSCSPGCSSLEGAFYELGLLTFVPGSAPNSQLQLNPFSWNNQSNVLYIEAPAGVGFSYADSAAGLVHNDSSTANDNLAAVQQFFSGFPEFQQNDLYIAGESYAGIYVPTLAYAIYLSNQALPAGQQGINLKGVMVGNGCIGNAAGVCGNDPQGPMWNIEQWKGHALISPGLYNKIMATCNFTALPFSSQCNSLLTQAQKMVGPINIYDVYQAVSRDGVGMQGNG